jgi:hypothetical protein
MFRAMFSPIIKQEHLTVFTVSGSVHPSCCRLVSRMSWNWTMLECAACTHRTFQHSPVSTHSRHQPAATWVNTTRHCKYSQVLLFDDRRKHRPKDVEPTWNNKLMYVVHLVGYFHSCTTMYGFMNVKSHVCFQNNLPKGDTIRSVYGLSYTRLNYESVGYSWKSKVPVIFWWKSEMLN